MTPSIIQRSLFVSMKKTKLGVSNPCTTSRPCME
ncbi:unnamed protein product [Enterobius vermicularis]|uniref:Uncharacterized protein n=1 Tax=Enterobius vermicularis TaxID=51028 RepID=A0A0N4UWE7_ENTVE|nr:unnamed protein product [Enterobius vermicularis]